jgi:hypothetical protein
MNVCKMKFGVMKCGALLAAALLGAAGTGCDEKASTPTGAQQGGSATPTPAAPAVAGGRAEFVDTDFGFRVTPTKGWRDVPATGVQVPGRVLKVWTTDGVNSIVAFVQEAGQPVTAKYLLDSSATSVKQSGYSVTFEQVVQVSGSEAMSMKLTGPGNGAAIGMGIGNTPTYQHWIAIPKQNRVLVLLLTAPDASKGEPAKGFEAMIQSVKLD